MCGSCGLPVALKNILESSFLGSTFYLGSILEFSGMDIGHFWSGYFWGTYYVSEVHISGVFEVSVVHISGVFADLEANCRTALLTSSTFARLEEKVHNLNLSS